MRHTQTRPSNKSSDVSTNLKNANTSQKCAGGSKRIGYDHGSKKSRKSVANEALLRKTTSTSQKVNLDTEKTQRKCIPTVVKRAAVNTRRIKKPNEKYKQIGSKIDKKPKTCRKVLKKVAKPFDRKEEHEGPPTLCETFSRITTMVAETVINEKENQKLAESMLGKAKKEAGAGDKSRREANNADSGAGKSKGESSTADSPASKVKKDSSGTSESASVKSKKEPPKSSADKKAKLVSPKCKAKLEKPKANVKKISTVKSAPAKKSNEKQASESSKVSKEDDNPGSGRGIITRRVSAPGSPESEKEADSKTESEKNKSSPQGHSSNVKTPNVTKTAEKGKVDKKPAVPAKGVAKRKEVVTRTKPEKKPKINDSQLQIKKLVDEVKSYDKDKDEGVPQECSLKRVNKNTKLTRNVGLKNSRLLLKKNVEVARNDKKPKKGEGTAPKTTKPKLGSETDGSNSDELTLNVIQKKARKNEKTESSPKVKSESDSAHEEVKIKVEGKMDNPEKHSVEKPAKGKKVKVEKDDDDIPFGTKILEELLKKRSKETESDTDEDLEFRRLLAKKLGKNMKAESPPQMKRKRVDSGQSDSDQRARRLRLFGFWSGPKRHRVASLNALAKVHCLYENESKGVMAEIEKMGQILRSDSKADKKPVKKSDKASDTKREPEDSENEKLDSIVINKRRLRGAPGTRGAGKHWDMFAAGFTTSTSGASSDESHSDTDMSKGRTLPLPPSYRQKMQKKEESDKEDAAKTPKRRRKTEIGITMDLKDMVVRKRMASLNASAILAASYSSEKRSTRKDSSGTSTEDSLSSPDEARGDFLSADESDTCNGKKSGEKSHGTSSDKARESQPDDPKRRKNFWKTKVESLKKAAKEKRNSPSPILADFGVGRDLSITVMEKEKKDEMNDDRERDRGNGSCKMKHGKRYTEVRSRSKGESVKNKSAAEKDARRGNLKSGKEGSSQSRKNLTKRKMKDDEVKNINIEKVNGSEKNDEYEYKSDSDNGQRKLIELRNTGGSNKKVAVIVNQDTDVTITGVYVNSTRSTHHEGFCSIAGMQYRISSTSHTQTEATAVLKTSIASEQTPPPTEPTNCTSPRNHKSYTPLSALSNMQPPAGAPPHPHLPPPPPPPPHHHHHHHHCGMGQHRPPPHDQYLGHGPPQGPISPLGRRHGCSSAFSAPHCSSQPLPGRNTSPSREEEGFGPPLPSHGYFQPAGPLIHHHASNPPVKSHNAVDSNTGTESQAPGSEESAPESSNRSGENPPPAPPPPPTASHHMGYPRGYPPYQGGYYQGGYYPPPPQSSHYQAPPPPPAFHHYHHHQDFCYPPGYPPSSYPPPATYRRFLQPAPGYFTSEVSYSSSVPPSSQDHGAQQMVVPGSPSSSYTAPLDPYPPPAPYYAGYSGPGPACYPHPPTSRSLAFIEQTYQSCPCPMQSCPKNVHIGPLTGECKRPGALPLPPVALQLPQEPPGAAGPPSPARGSAGMPPLPSPVSNSARPNCGPPWDGRQAKSTAVDPIQPDAKWDESKTKLDVKTRCKNEMLYADGSGNWNATDLTKSNAQKCLTTLRISDLTNRKWVATSEEARQNKILPPPQNHQTFSQVQGLLAISSTELTKVSPVLSYHNQDGEVIGNADDGKTIKSESEKLSTEKHDEENGHVGRKRKSAVVDEVEKCRKKKKGDDEAEEVVQTALSDELVKKSKRKLDGTDENAENKVKKVKKKLTVNQKYEIDSENMTTGNAKKSQKCAIHPKPKLLKDRNETVSGDTVSEVIEQVIKGQTNRRKKKTEVEDGVVTDKISKRRKSTQEKWTAPPSFPDCPRKSRSCSPNRSRLENSHSPVRVTNREEGRRRASESSKSSSSSSSRSGKCKVESRSKSTEKISQEHSKNSKSGGGGGGGGGACGGRKNSGGGNKIGVSILGRSAQNGCSSSGVKSKKANGLSVTNLKKSLATKIISSCPRTGISPKWSNGWSWDSESFDAKVYLTNDEAPVMRKCYSAMRHVEGDVIQPKDCILLKAGPRKIDLPFVAKVAALWENPDDGEMMVSLLWYYRPEHTDQGRQPSDQQDEIFASRHKDINSVACIEDKCFVLTYNEYCRYRKKVKRLEEGIEDKNPPVPLSEQPYPRLHRQPPCIMAPDMVFFCRRVYDFRQKRLLKNPT